MSFVDDFFTTLEVYNATIWPMRARTVPRDHLHVWLVAVDRQARAATHGDHPVDLGAHGRHAVVGLQIWADVGLLLSGLVGFPLVLRHNAKVRSSAHT